MPDPPNTQPTVIIPSESDTEKVKAHAGAWDSVAKAMGLTQDAQQKSVISLSDIKDKLQSVSAAMSGVNDLTGEQATKLGLLTTVLVGTRDAFKDLGSIDTSGINTFSKQFTDVIGVLAKGDNAISDLTEFAASAFGKMIPTDILKKGVFAVKDFLIQTASNFAASADNAVKLQTAFIQMSASTGNLGEVLKAAGTDLSNMNSVLGMQQQMLNDTAQATQLSADDVEKYYIQLGKIPGALTATVQASTSASSATNMLTATIQLAKGSGMSYQQIMTNLSSAFKSYGATGETALKFTARMSEISKNYNLELDDIQKGLKDSAEAFKLYGSSGENAGRALEGTVKIMNNYIGALKEAGISGAESINIITNMTQKLGGLDLAQKSFLSSQSGGPGGLRGAYAMERKMREDPAAAMEDLRKAMMKQFGSIVTREQAETSEAAAAQYTKQTLMLQQGPFGALAKDQQSAEALLAAFGSRAGGKAPVKELRDDIVGRTMETGLKFQETTASEAGRIRQLIQTSQGNANITNLGLMQNAFGTRTGTMSLGYTVEQQNAQRNRREYMERGRIAGGEGAQQLSEGLATGNIIDSSGSRASRNIREYGDLFNNLSIALGQPISTIKQLLVSTSTNSAKVKENADKMMALLDARIESIRKEAESEQNVDKRQKLISQLNKTKSLRDFTADQVSAAIEFGENTPTPGAQVRGAVPSATRAITNTAATTPAAATATAQNIPATAGSQEHHIFVQGICLKCHREMDRQSVQQQVNTPQGTD